MDATYRITTLSILLVLSLSTLSAIAYAAPIGTNNGKDWQYTNGNSWAQNYTPETQINKDTVKNLELKWVFPLDSKSAAVAAMQGITMEGSTTPPLVVNGKVFVATQYGRTYAIDAASGKLLWTYDYVINITDAQNKVPVDFGGILPGIGLMTHMHGFRYWAAGNSILMNGYACDVYGINADTGKESFHINNLCKDIPGNLYKYRTGTMSTTNIGTYDKGRQFITVQPGQMHSYIYGGDARHVTTGVSMDAPYNILWRIYSFPPQDKPTKDWATQECSIGYFLTTPCTEVQAKNPSNLEWDWAQPGQVPPIWAGVTANWGEVVVDEDTGIAYTQTGNQGPYTWIGSTPGPRLYGSTIYAIDLAQGKRIWWYQPFPRDPYDYDCNWAGILADVPNVGKIYMKGCKEGHLNVLDAKTGKPIYVKDEVDEEIAWGQITSAAAKEPYQGGVRYHYNDIMSAYDIRQMNAPDNSTYCKGPCEVFPNFMNGMFATDMSYDPTTNTLYHYAAALQTRIVKSLPAALGVNTAITTGTYPTNTTIVARDAATGNIKWKWFYPTSQQRAAMVVTSDLVFAGFTDGYLRFFDKSNGNLLREMNMGSNMQIQFTTGQDSKGDQKIFGLLGIASTFGGSNPGTVVALGLSGQAAGGAAQTTTVTTTTTSVTTSTTTQTTTSATTSTVTSTSATTSTVTSTSATTATTTLVSTQPAQTTTVVSSVTESSGLPAEVTYALAAVAVIAIIAAAFLAMRKK